MYTGEVVKVCVYICLLGVLAVSCGASDGGQLSTEEEWEEMFRNKVNERKRMTRDVTSDMEIEIQDVQEYYRHVFETFNNRVAIQDNGQDEEAPIPGRYLVLFKEEQNDNKLDSVIAVLESVNAESHGKVAAKDIEPLRHIGKGFTASLGQTAVEAVSIAHTHTHMLILTPHSHSVYTTSHTHTHTYTHTHYDVICCTILCFNFNTTHTASLSRATLGSLLSSSIPL